VFEVVGELRKKEHEVVDEIETRQKLLG
jgi:hypothetical protein